jgi:hypothetical protein
MDAVLGTAPAHGSSPGPEPLCLSSDGWQADDTQATVNAPTNYSLSLRPSLRGIYATVRTPSLRLYLTIIKESSLRDCLFYRC